MLFLYSISFVIVILLYIPAKLIDMTCYNGEYLSLCWEDFKTFTTYSNLVKMFIIALIPGVNIIAAAFCLIHVIIGGAIDLLDYAGGKVDRMLKKIDKQILK